MSCDMDLIAQRLRWRLARGKRECVSAVRGEGEGVTGRRERMRFTAKIVPAESKAAECELRKYVRYEATHNTS